MNFRHSMSENVFILSSYLNGLIRYRIRSQKLLAYRIFKAILHSTLASNVAVKHSEAILIPECA